MSNRVPFISALAALLAALATCSAASADSGTFSRTDGIHPEDQAPPYAVGLDPARYPSRISVGGLAGSITNVKVEVLGITSKYPGDLDVLLVSPGGRQVILMSDAGGAAKLNDIDFTFSADAPGLIPSSGAVPSGSYLPTNRNGNDGPDDFFPFPAPNGVPVTLAGLDGSEPNGKWGLYVVDDQNGDTSQIYGWRLTVESTGGTVVSSNAPVIGTERGAPGSPPGTASPYPSKLQVAGVPRKLARVTVTLHDVAFEAPADADILLVGPNGHSVVLTSDAGGGPGLYGENISFDDAAVTGPDVPMTGGKAFAPTDLDNSSNQWENLQDVYPAPAPQDGSDPGLSAFAGSDPNGEWALYMTDDQGGGGRVDSIVGGWSLNLTLSGTPVDPPAPPTPDPAAPPADVPPSTPPVREPDPVAPAPTALRLTALRLSPRTFTARRGTTVRYRLSRAAKVRLTVRLKGKKRATLVRDGAAGANRLRFKARIGKRTLKPGSYRLTATPIDASGKTGTPRTVRFRLRRP